MDVKRTRCDNVGYIQRVKDFQILFPVYEATMRVTSERLVDFEQFTRFVFQMIGNDERLTAIRGQSRKCGFTIIRLFIELEMSDSTTIKLLIQAI